MNDSQEICRMLGDIKSQLDGLTESQASIHNTLRNLQSFLSGSEQTEKQSDGPIPPDTLRFRGINYEGFTTLEWRALDSLWGRDAVAAEALCDHIYGHDHDDKDDALRSLLKRLNRKLHKKSVPMNVSPVNGCFILKRWKVQERGSNDLGTARSA